jgi:hypothetical protein
MTPPVVPGLTQLPEPSPSAGLDRLVQLLGGAQGGSRPAAMDLKEGMAALRRAAAADPQLAERVRRALAAIEGEDGMPGRMGRPDRSPSMASTVGAAMQTPI